MRKWITLFSTLVTCAFLIFSELTVMESISVGITIFFFLDFLDNLGKKVVIFDVCIMLALVTCLVMPAVFYHQFPRTNHLARKWIKYMFIPSDDYFAFALPAVIAMIIGFKIPLAKLNVNSNPTVYMDKMKEELKKKQQIGILLVWVGLVSGLFTKIVPGGLQQFFLFLDHLIYVGVFYVLYSPNKYKNRIVPLVIAIMVGESVAVGMFGELIYMLAISLILIFLGNKISFGKKVAFAVSGMYLILLIQSVKMDYRKQAWLSGEGADPVYFAQLIGERVSDPSSMYNENTTFLAAVRLNQGWLVSVTMFFVPKKFPFANGETIWKSIAASFVPRFMWPDKPEAGGKENLRRFWGYNIRGYSMNIGPLGEAYGNFGAWGGVIYMFFYGLFFNVLLSGVLKLSNKIPTLILWIPFLFVGTVTFETDLLTTMNLLTKGLFFAWLIFKIFKIFFRKEL